MTDPVLPGFDGRRLFEAVPDKYLVLDRDFMIVGVSDAYAAATLTRRDEIVGRHLFDVFPDNPGDGTATGVGNLRASLQRVLATKAPDSMAVQKYDIPLPPPSTDWEVRHWSCANYPLVDDDGTVVGIIHRAEDVTAYVQQQASLREKTSQMEVDIVLRSHQLQEANAKLRVANEARGEFLSRVSHELRTPMTAILGFGEILSLSDLDDESREWVDTILRAGRHLLQLLNDVLDISRIDSGQLLLSPEPVPAAGLVDDVCEIMRPLAKAAGIRLLVPKNAASGGYVLADNQRLRQVLINLVSNAIRYNRPDGTVTVVLARSGKDRFRIDVTDTGRGLTADQLAKLFVPFERLDAAETNVQGTGLGLVLSRRLAENMGGALTVVSTPGTGSTFTVELAETRPVTLSPEPATSAIVEERRYDGSRTVLYVEDMIVNVKLVEVILRRRPDVTLVSAMQGSVALELARDTLPDLVLLDLHLPDMNGEEILRLLKADDRTADIPVVILSADATARQLDSVLSAGAHDYLTKPMTVTALLKVVDEALGRTESEATVPSPGGQ